MTTPEDNRRETEVPDTQADPQTHLDSDPVNDPDGASGTSTGPATGT